MCPADEVQVVLVQEFGHHLGPEGEGDPTVVLPPALHILVRVGPEQVTEQPLIRDICGSHDPPDLLHRLQVWGQPCGKAAPPELSTEISPLLQPSQTPGKGHFPPPWQQKIFSSTMAAMGKQLKQSVKVFQSLMLYLRLPAGDKGDLEVSLGTALGWAAHGKAGGYKGRAGKHGVEGRSQAV